MSIWARITQLFRKAEAPPEPIPEPPVKVSPVQAIILARAKRKAGAQESDD